MDLEIKSRRSYASEIAFLSIMTLVFGIGCIFFGYLLLPVASGFYAALLACEKREGRILSYVLPLIPITLSVFIINTFYSLDAIAYVVVGLIIYIGFEKKHNKAITTLISVIALLIMFFVSLIFVVLDQYGQIKALTSFLGNSYKSGKNMFISYLTNSFSVDENGQMFNNYNPAEAVDIYNSFVISLIPLMVIFALASAAIAMRILASNVSKYNSEDKRLVGWKFVTSPFLAYSYLVLVVLSSLSQEGIVGISLSFIATIFMVIYFYVGLCATFNFISKKKSSGFAIVVIVGLFFVIQFSALEIISFIGVFVNNSAYKAKKAKKTDT